MAPLPVHPAGFALAHLRLDRNRQIPTMAATQLAIYRDARFVVLHINTIRDYAHPAALET